jgi:hypothetical protein
MAKPGVIYPSKQEIEVALSRNSSMVNGIQELFIKYKISGWEPAYAVIKKQLEDYDNWIRLTVMPKARTDFRLPAEEYKLQLEGYGIDIPPAELAKMAHTAFTNIQNQMKPVAGGHQKYKLPSADYREVISFEKDQALGIHYDPL